MIDKIKVWYCTKVQRSLASFLAGLSVTDLVAAIVGTESYISEVIGTKAYACIRVVCAGIIYLRAHQHVRDQNGRV